MVPLLGWRVGCLILICIGTRRAEVNLHMHVDHWYFTPLPPSLLGAVV